MEREVKKIASELTRIRKELEKLNKPNNANVSVEKLTDNVIEEIERRQRAVKQFQ